MHPSIMIHTLGYRRNLDGPPTLDFIPNALKGQADVSPSTTKNLASSAAAEIARLDNTELASPNEGVRESKIQRIAEQIKSVNDSLLAEYKASQKA